MGVFAEKIFSFRHAYSAETTIQASGPVIKGLDAFLHTMILGPTGCGKTSRIIKPMIRQVLEGIKQGKKVGMTVIEPKGDLAQNVADMCKELGIPCIHIDPVHTLSAHFNPLQGDAEDVAEATRTVLKILFGKQDPFFAQVQQTAARNVVLLLKELNGDNIDLMDVVRALRNPVTLQGLVQQVKQIQGQTDLVQYFEAEVLGSMKDKFQQFATGLRQQLEDIAGNKYLKNIFSGNSDIDLDTHLEDGGVLVVNTEMGKLGKLGDTLGLFILMHLQNAVFRRPGTEWTRTPHYLFVDEFSRYVNPDVERLLAIGRSFRCACIFAFQSFAQLVLDGDPKFADKVLTNMLNKICFPGLSAEDAKKFEKEFGQELREKQSKTHKSLLLGASPFADGYKKENRWESRYNFTQIMEFERFHFLHRLSRDSQPLAPGYAKGFLVEEMFPKDSGDQVGNSQQTENSERKSQKAWFTLSLSSVWTRMKVRHKVEDFKGNGERAEGDVPGQSVPTSAVNEPTAQSVPVKKIRPEIAPHIKQIRRDEDGFVELVMSEEYEKQQEQRQRKKWLEEQDEIESAGAGDEAISEKAPEKRITFTFDKSPTDSPSTLNQKTVGPPLIKKSLLPDVGDETEELSLTQENTEQEKSTGDKNDPEDSFKSRVLKCAE